MKQELNKPFIVIGAGGHSRVVIDALELLERQILGIVDILYKQQKEQILSYPVVGGLPYLEDLNPNEIILALAIGDNDLRASVFHDLQGKGFQIATIIHPAAQISKHATLANGVFINAGAIINCQVSIGENSIINTGAIIEHEVEIGKHCHIGPGAKIAGRAKIGSYTFVGLGANIINCIDIGEHVTVGAGAVVIDKIVSHCTVAGVPAKKFK